MWVKWLIYAGYREKKIAGVVGNLLALSRPHIVEIIEKQIIQYLMDISQSLEGL